MTLRLIGTTSDEGDCPTLYEIEGRMRSSSRATARPAPNTLRSCGT